ncbi:GNAT family N-acetyltransferase [Dongshaea marina]|uniref:GNAT family N-acetyltransferase n=1 Tax=Dongshaea marina TaxID=2047966 RepID=UPI000D3E8A45|nr:GNAT family N-acetyltransferase [Dongshaea marina]
MAITYKINHTITVEQFRHVLQTSTLGERRPIEDESCLQSMLDHGNLTVTAWEGEELIGIARSVTDFSFCCYLSDLAVSQQIQAKGVGKELIRQTRTRLGDKCAIILLAAPAAQNYYPHIGFKPHNSAWLLEPEDPLI